MKLLKTRIDGPKIIKTEIFRDSRGFLKETYRKNIVNKKEFPFDVMSFSKKNVLRGLHIQTKKPQAKIITVTYGKIFDVAVDLRKNSKSFGKYVGITISDKDNFSFYIPEGFAHGFLCLSKECTVNYKCSQYRVPESEKTLSWDDPDVNIKWLIKKPILSDKDKNLGLSLNEFYNLK
ncbi:dTDP-4-dehydrorhamnose 3,5-epimerase [Candidatus Pelagibacter sp. Uisw_092]|uniref:dTDP-4-dehydrorhamnose 3,5-epimerase n=1 Tax=Candidatus Pelagibacter sp. Uisw_092 TaxID=3230979 RepID=UPI0039EA7F80